MNFIDLFAGAGGLSEGFIRAGFEPIAHVEMDEAACNTLLTRTVYHHVKNEPDFAKYISYIKGEDLTRDGLYNLLPEEKRHSVINLPIGDDTNDQIFKQIDQLKGNQNVDLIIGGPPCQAYSVIGRGGALRKKKNDERKTLYIHYGRYLKRYQPKVFVFENVPGILVADGGQYFRNLKKYYRQLGYIVEAEILNAKDFGVVQNRRRVIIIGWRKELQLEYPKFNTHPNRYTRNDIFNDLPHIKPGENKRYHSYALPTNEYLSSSEIRNGINFVTQHIARPHNRKDLNIYRLAIEQLEDGIRLKNNKIPDNMRTQANVKDFVDRFKVVADEPHTMIAHIAKDGHHFIHPDKNQLRSISVREAARIQSFPDDYFFEGVKEDQYRTAAFRQIGNAVPPLMAVQIAHKLRNLLQNGRTN
ncbi:restriction endonuclease subunit M [Prolixibacter bellariivorans]|uniref:Cytosine-specific methyltransferase n=3 Tax=Prolixibacter bellariivorans TaxID=314319 RepID=A0A5M4B367_9BACT|nr:DNA cytosine methyltransferase [Prolixibacter bellariivorans]GET34572.1 restriction endonuclease subunit M [Prolixibacter bellariivorans]